MSKVVLCALVFLLASVTQADAADAQGRFAVKSVGTATCARYLKAREAGGVEYALYGGYLGGYLTSYNQLAADTFDIAAWENTDTLAGMLANFCERNLETSFASAAGRLLLVLRPKRIKSDSPRVRGGKGEQQESIYQDTLKRAQDELSELGLYEGEADGRYSDTTRNAFRKFQELRGLTVTGAPDQATLYRLFHSSKRSGQ